MTHLEQSHANTAKSLLQSHVCRIVRAHRWTEASPSYPSDNGQIRCAGADAVHAMALHSELAAYSCIRKRRLTDSMDAAAGLNVGLPNSRDPVVAALMAAQPTPPAALSSLVPMSSLLSLPSSALDWLSHSPDASIWLHGAWVRALGLCFGWAMGMLIPQIEGLAGHRGMQPAQVNTRDKQSGRAHAMWGARCFSQLCLARTALDCLFRLEFNAFGRISISGVVCTVSPHSCTWAARCFPRNSTCCSKVDWSSARCVAFLSRSASEIRDGSCSVAGSFTYRTQTWCNS